MKQKTEFTALDIKQFDVKSFDCGKDPINRFLRRFAAKHMAASLSATFILPYQKSGQKDSEKLDIAAFYTLANHALSPELIPTAKSLPHFDIPVILLAQLGVSIEQQKRGLGAVTLTTALQHAYAIATHPEGIPSYGVILDAIDNEALRFYLSFDFFIPFAGNPTRLFVPMQTIECLVHY